MSGQEALLTFALILCFGAVIIFLALAILGAIAFHEIEKEKNK